MPLPASQALPFLEWGMNWAISNHAHQDLILPAASLERESQAIILPGVPGAGKSTLCAGLVSRGWRLLSDELTLIRLKDGLIDALSRPISLKNASIDIVRGLLGNEDIGPVCTDTGKGTVAHAKPPTASIEAANAMNPVATRPAWIVFPTYVPNAPVQIDEIGRARGFMDLQAQAFNFDLIGGEAFKSLSNLVNQTRLCRVSYGSMDLAFEGLREITGVRF
jgi:HprK-related kinase A